MGSPRGIFGEFFLCFGFDGISLREVVFLGVLSVWGNCCADLGCVSRLARRGGVKRLSAMIYDDVRVALKERLTDVCYFAQGAGVVLIGV